VISVAEGLARLVARGLISLERLDAPTPAWAELERDRQCSASRDLCQGWPGRHTPATRYPGAGSAEAPRNLAREWIEANPKAWSAMLEPPLAAVQADQQADLTDPVDVAA
jgi:hypothetical protein